MAKSNNRLIADLLSGQRNEEVQVKEEIVFEGATENDFETTFQVIDPTADRTITYPDDSGVIALTKNTASNAALQSFIANTNSYIAGVQSNVDAENARVDLLNTNLTSTNTAIRLLISDKMQVANVQSYIANTNLRLTTLELQNAVEGGGFVLGTLSDFPGTDGDFDYHEGGTETETYVGSTGVSGTDPFGVSLQAVYDNMDPIGRLVGEDLGTL